MTPISDTLLSRRRFVHGSAALSAALAMGFPAFAAVRRAEAAGEQTLRLACEEPETFDTGTIGGGIGIQWANHLFEGLTRYDWENQQVVPGAAKSWDISADNLTYTFHLNEGMLWSDGSPVTAGDFEYAIKRNLEPGLAGPLATFLYPLKGAEEFFTGATTDPATIAVTAKDDLTLEMTLNAVTPYWLILLSLWTCVPINKKSIDAGGVQWTEPGTIISNGRYKMESWEHDQSMVLVQNENYHGEKPTITRIEYTIFENPPEQALTAFQTGDVDLAQVTVANFDFVSNDPELSPLQYHQAVSGTWQLRLDMGNTASALADVNVRKALYLAIDRDVLTQTVLKGYMTPAYVLLPPDVPSYNPEVRLQGTIEDAKKYLADAGFANGEGFPGLQLGFAAAQENAQLVSEAIIQMWKDTLGITNAQAFAVPSDWRTRIRTENYDMYLGQWVTDFPDPYEWHNVIFEGDAWQSKWKDQTYLDLVKAANVEVDPAKRLQMFSDAEKYMIQDQMATIPLYTVGRLWVIQPWVQNLKLSPYDGPLLNIDDVTIADH
ncbi:MAG: oligopeptide transport system substrate-binding protein [Thermomicrobiales bacterium]|jgi:oligopeptide transport system substrate-binding protein|nr:oligopeptide transport system substrate-binding protein [Thermomicrobiales bacterium]